MFSLGVRSLCEEILEGHPWAYLGCASFEPRWDAFAGRAERLGARPAGALVLQPDNRSSRWYEECSGRQRQNWNASIVRTLWNAAEHSIALPSPLSWGDANGVLAAIKLGTSASTLVVDITTMPRSAFFPVLKAALAPGAFETVVAVYSEPQKYHPGSLSSEPTAAAILSGFDGHAPASASTRSRAAWLPILGFGPQFLTAVYESLVDSFEFGSRVYPVLGFPAYNPQFFERALADGGRAVLEILRQREEHGDRFVYAAATDPFETADALMRLVDSSEDGLTWIGTPTGPKPMALGMLLCALQRPLTILVAPPRTYHFEYSEGSRRTHAYVLQRLGKRTYEA